MSPLAFERYSAAVRTGPSIRLSPSSAELILVGADGEEDRHEKRDFPEDEGELRAPIEQDDHGQSIDEKQTELTDEHEGVADEHVSPKLNSRPQSKRHPMSRLHDDEHDRGQNEVL